MKVTVVSGMSGSGKSVALHTLEDEGYYCVDNLPGSLLTALIEKLVQASPAAHDCVAVGIDARNDAKSIAVFMDLLNELKSSEQLEVEILFLETTREVLLKRFSETRRRHPLTSKGTTLVAAIEKEADFLLAMKEQADLVIDTSRLNLHQLREIILSRVIEREPKSLAILLQSFGFKYGMPASSDFIFDVRCLPNPYWDSAIRSHSGLDEPIRKFLQEHDSVEKMYQDISGFLDNWLPVFTKENRSYLTVSVGCTGGRHRSVYLISRLAEHFEQKFGNITIRHRELK